MFKNKSFKNLIMLIVIISGFVFVPSLSFASNPTTYPSFDSDYFNGNSPYKIIIAEGRYIYMYYSSLPLSVKSSTSYLGTYNVANGINTNVEYRFYDTVTNAWESTSHKVSSGNDSLLHVIDGSITYLDYKLYYDDDVTLYSDLVGVSQAVNVFSPNAYEFNKQPELHFQILYEGKVYVHLNGDSWSGNFEYISGLNTGEFTVPGGDIPYAWGFNTFKFYDSSGNLLKKVVTYINQADLGSLFQNGYSIYGVSSGKTYDNPPYITVYKNKQAVNGRFFINGIMEVNFSTTGSAQQVSFLPSQLHWRTGENILAIYDDDDNVLYSKTCTLNNSAFGDGTELVDGYDLIADDSDSALISSETEFPEMPANDANILEWLVYFVKFIVVLINKIIFALGDLFTKLQTLLMSLITNVAKISSLVGTCLNGLPPLWVEIMGLSLTIGLFTWIINRR